MIVLAVIAFSAVVLTLVFAALGGIPTLPPAVTVYANLAINYIKVGSGIFFQLCYSEVVIPLLVFTMAITTIFYAYKFVMFIVKKIPFFGVSD